MLQQAIGGVEGEIRVALQYLFQAWGPRGPKKYRDMLLDTATEEIAPHRNARHRRRAEPRGCAPALQEEAAKTTRCRGVLGGMDPRHYLSTGLGAMPATRTACRSTSLRLRQRQHRRRHVRRTSPAEATGRALATRLYEMTDDPGMKDMLSFMIARDTMHQQQWLAVIEELGGCEGALPIPNSFPQDLENSEFSYVFLSTAKDGQPLTEGRWTQGPSLDGKGEYSQRSPDPLGQAPQLAPPLPSAYAQNEQMSAQGGVGQSSKHRQ